VRAGNLGGAQDAQSGLQTDRAVPKKTAPRPIKGSWQGFQTEHLGKAGSTGKKICRLSRTRHTDCARRAG
jgi:hypothetical protein